MDYLELEMVMVYFTGGNSLVARCLVGTVSKFGRYLIAIAIT